MDVSEEDIAEEIRSQLPGTEEIIVQYISGYLLDLEVELCPVSIIASAMCGLLSSSATTQDMFASGSVHRPA